MTNFYIIQIFSIHYDKWVNYEPVTIFENKVAAVFCYESLKTNFKDRKFRLCKISKKEVIKS